MIMLFALFLTGKSDLFALNYDFKLNLLSQNMYLFLQNDSIEIRDNINSKAAIYHSKAGDNRATFLNLAVIPHPEQKYKLFLVSKVLHPISFTANVTCLGSNDAHFEISFLPEQWVTQNTVFLDFYVNQPNLISFSEVKPQINLKIFNSRDKQLITQILPLSQRKKLILCYDGYNCPANNGFSVSSDETYLSLVNDKNLADVVNKFGTKLDFIRIFFASESSPKADFSILPFNLIQKVELFGYSKKNPSKIKLADHIVSQIKTKLEIKDIQFVNEAKSDNSISPIKAKASIGSITYDITPDFKNNPNFTLLVTNNIIYIANNETISEEDMPIIPLNSAEEVIIQIQNQQSDIKNPRIFIKPYNDVKRIPLDSVKVRYENQYPINIEFSGWAEYTLDNVITFDFISETQSALSFTSSRNINVRYRHYSLYNALYDEYPSNFVFCLMNNQCNDQSYSPNKYFQFPIPFSAENKENVSLLIEKQFDDKLKRSVQSFIFLMNSNCNQTNLNLSCFNGNSLQKIQFISPSVLVHVNIIDFPSTQENEWTVTRCSLNFVSSKSYIINDLISTYSEFSLGQVTISHGTYIKAVTLNTDDVKIDISSNNFKLDNYNYKETDDVTLEVKMTAESNASFIFSPVSGSQTLFNVKLNFKGVDENSHDIPIKTLPSDWSDTKVTGTISIFTPSTDHVVISTILSNVNIYEYDILTNKVKQIIPTLSSHPKIAICYLSDQCVNQSDFSIESNSIFISTKTEQNFADIIQSVNSNYDYLKMIFIGAEQTINVEFKYIPANHFEQIQMHGYNNPKVSLSSEARNFKNWTVHHVALVPISNLKYTFDELTVIDTNPVFEGIPDFSENISIGTAKLHCLANYDINGLSKFNQINHTVYEIFPQLDTDNFVFSISGSAYLPNGNLQNPNGSPRITPLNTQFTFFIRNTNKVINHTFYICRYDNFFSEISLVFEEGAENMPVYYECKSNEPERAFIYNLVSMNGKPMSLHQGTCKNLVTNLNGNHSLPTPTASISSVPPTAVFSRSVKFTQSDPFSNSEVFTPSSRFTISSQFPDSSVFPDSEKFSPSSIFSRSSVFTSSSDFSLSLPFNSTLEFTPSLIFTSTPTFTNTPPFTASSAFTESSKFTDSSPFNPTFSFDRSLEFTPSSTFTPTLTFTATSIFTASSPFTASSKFTASSSFSPSFPFHQNETILDQLPTVLINSSNTKFNIIQQGYIGDRDNETNLSNYSNEVVTISFKSTSITISESSELRSSALLYFAPENDNSVIIIDKDFKNSTIGIKTDKSPTVVLANSQYNMNILNNIYGYSTMKIQNNHVKDDETRLALKQVDNRNGYFSLSVPNQFRSVSFTSLFMSRDSSFNVHSNSNSNSNSRLLENEDDVKIIVEDDININSKAKAIIGNVEILGSLNVYDDSSLTFNRDVTFSSSSEIDVILHNSKNSNKEPIIYFDKPLNSVPSKIILSFENSKARDVSKLILLEADKFLNCSAWVGIVQFKQSNSRKINAKCQYVDTGSMQFVISAKKKLSAGAIAGIVVACLAVVAVIISVIIYFVVCKKKDKAASNCSELQDESTF